jgi:type II secretory pathway component PulF
MSDKASSRVAFWAMLLIHCAAGFVLFAVLVGYVPKFEALFARLHERGELPAITALTLALSKYWYCLLVFGFALDAGVLFVLGRLPPKLRRLAILWFGAVLFAIVLLLVIVLFGLLTPVLKMSNTI